MKYPLPHKLTEFLDFSPIPQNILLIESEYYLKEVVSTFPTANIYFCSKDRYKISDILTVYAERIYYVPVAYNEERLPFERYFFDLIIGDELFSENFNPQDIASGLCSFITPTGYLLTSFSNLLFKPWTDKLLNDERSEFIVRRGYTREDFERLMVASFYKEIFFEPLYIENEAEPPYYMAKAYTSVLPVRNLKSVYTKKVRERLSILLRRIEYGVMQEESVAALKTLANDEGIFKEYILDMANEACYSREYVKNIVRKYIE